MIGVGVQYLCGWAAATDPAAYDEPEWPPHPARLFMALAAALFETLDDPPTAVQKAERRVLEWLEKAESPGLRVSGHEVRAPVSVFVPVNDTEISSRINTATASEKSVKDNLGVLPDRRSRQARTFPRAIPHEDTVWFIWANAEPGPEEFEALDRLCRKVTRIGHSSSVVRVWAARGDDVPPPDLVPNPENTSVRLRGTAPGFLEELEARYEAGLRPVTSIWHHYGDAAVDHGIPFSVFDPGLLVVKLVPGTEQRRGATLPLNATGKIVQYFRRAVISAAAEPVPETLSGHAPDGGVSNRTHAAFIPLPFVGHEHADGHLLGLAIALPEDLKPAEIQSAQESLATLTSRPDDSADPGRLVMGRLGRWRLEPLTVGPVPYSLRSETWTTPSSVWASATPLVLDRFVDDEEEKRAVVATACERIGLPRPVEVRLSRVSPLPGAPPSPKFGPLPRSGDRPARPFTHALLVFSDGAGDPLPVRGPVLLGAGRYRGYGLFRPLNRWRSP